MKRMEERYIVDARGEKTAVIIPTRRYEQLIEDLHDLAVVAERREEKEIDFVEMRKRLRRDEEV